MAEAKLNMQTVSILLVFAFYIFYRVDGFPFEIFRERRIQDPWGSEVPIQFFLLAAGFLFSLGWLTFSVCFEHGVGLGGF